MVKFMERINVAMGSQERFSAEKEGFLFPVEAGPTLTYKDWKGKDITYRIADDGGSQKVIVNEKDYIVSKPYMDFKHHINSGNFSFLVGSNRAMQHILNHVDEQFIQGDENPFNGRIQFRRDLQRFVVWCGARQYLIDDNGRMVSEGYHKILPAKMHGLKVDNNHYFLEQIREYK